MATLRTIFLGLGLGACLMGCGSDADSVCARIYDECKGALIDDRGASLVRESCVQKLDAVAETDAEKVAAIARCAGSAACDELPACLEL